MMAVVFLDVWSSNKHGIGQTPLMDGVPVPRLKFSWRYSRRETSSEISESVSSLTQLRSIFFRYLHPFAKTSAVIYEATDLVDIIQQTTKFCNSCRWYAAMIVLFWESLPIVSISCLGLRMCLLTPCIHPKMVR